LRLSRFAVSRCRCSPEGTKPLRRRNPSNIGWSTLKVRRLIREGRRPSQCDRRRVETRCGARFHFRSRCREAFRLEAAPGHGISYILSNAVQGRPKTMHLDQGSVTHRAAHAGHSWPRRLAPVAAVVLVMALVFAMGWHRYLSLETLVRHRAAIDSFVAARCPLAVATFIAVYVAAVALSIPGAAILTITGGVLFGWVVGGLAAMIGATTGATIVFLIARGACGESILRRAGPLASKLADGFRADAFH